MPLNLVIQKTEALPDVVQFCMREDLANYLQLAGRLISECFPHHRGLEIRLEVDPETGEESVVMDLSVAGDIDKVLQQSDCYTSRWVESVPWPQSGKIHLLYNVE